MQSHIPPFLPGVGACMDGMNMCPSGVDQTWPCRPSASALPAPRGSVDVSIVSFLDPQKYPGEGRKRFPRGSEGPSLLASPGIWAWPPKREGRRPASRSHSCFSGETTPPSRPSAVATVTAIIMRRCRAGLPSGTAGMHRPA